MASLKLLKNTHVKIGTHSGVFHCDELLGTFLLQSLLPDSEVVRSRDNDILKQCDIVIDVGNEYDPARLLFDHHQKGFNESMSSILPGKHWATKLSSAGLVYCHFGTDFLKNMLGNNTSEEKVNAIFDHIYENFIQEIDAIDNGFPMFEGEPRYRITTGLSSRVNHLNKPWNVSDNMFNEDEAFKSAQKYVGSEFENKVRRAADIWWPAREIVLNAVKKCYDVDPSGQVIELEKFCPWKEHFFDIQKEQDLDQLNFIQLGQKERGLDQLNWTRLSHILYVIFEDSQGSWRVQAVPLNAGSYVCRMFLPNEWCGLRDKELCDVAKIDGCIFAHHTGFIGGNKTREGALKMALTSIKLQESQ